MTSATPSFLPVELGVYRFELTVTAGEVSDTDIVELTVVGRPDLIVNQDDGETAVLPGDSVTYSVTIANTGNAPATGVLAQSTLSQHSVFLDASDGGIASGGVVRWPLFDLAVQQATTRTVTVRIVDRLPAGVDGITNSVEVVDDGALGPDPTPENNTAADTNQLVAAPDVAISLDDGRSQALPGDTLSYVMTVSNLGNQAATGVRVSYSLPASSGFVNASDGGALGENVVSWPLFSLSASATVTRSVTIQLDALWPPGLEAVESRATAGDDGTNGPDQQSANNVAVDRDTVTLPDLSVSTDNGETRLVPGQETTYVINVRNGGKAEATGVLLIDELPPEVVFVAASDAGQLESGRVIWPNFGLIPEASSTRSVTVRVEEILPEEVTAITNRVSVADDGAHGPDPTPEDNDASDTDSVSFLTDLSVRQEASPDPARVEDELAYTIVVTNSGTSTATGVTLQDLLLGTATLNSVAASQGSCRETLPMTCTLGSLEATESATVTLAVTPLVEGSITNVITVAGNQVESSEGDNSDLLTTVVLPVPTWELTNEAFIAGVGVAAEKDGGLAWCDFNQDGFLDLLLNTDEDRPEARSRLLFNQGDGTFLDVTETHANGLTRRKGGRSAVCGDINDDGHLDFVRNDYDRVEIYFNRGPQADPPWSFGISVNQLPNRPFPNLPRGMDTEGVGLLDFDLDGDLDVVVDNHAFGIALIENLGAGHLEQHPLPELFGLPSLASAGDYMAVTDYDADGWVDVLDRKADQFDLWRNLGGTFEANLSFDEQTTDFNKGGAAFCDLDADGDFDLVWTDAVDTQIWRNDSGSFTPTGEPSLSSGTDMSGEDIDGVACADMDNDGDLDLFLSADAGPSHLFLNETPTGSATFSFVADNRGIDVGLDGEAVAIGDYDRDGDLDLVVNVANGANQLWQSHRNDEGLDDYLVVRALRCLPNGLYRDDIGATLRLFHADGLTPLSPIREVNGGRGHGSQSPAGVHFGLPQGASARYMVEVWFTGSLAMPVWQDVLPNELQGDYQVLEVKNCSAGNDPPVTLPDLVRTQQAVPVTVELRGFDPEGHPVVFAVETLPVHGTIGLEGKTLTYTPDVGFLGRDSLTFVAWDGAATSLPATLEFHVVEPESAAIPVDVVPSAERAEVVGLDTGVEPER